MDSAPATLRSLVREGISGERGRQWAARLLALLVMSTPLLPAPAAADSHDHLPHRTLHSTPDLLRTRGTVGPLALPPSLAPPPVPAVSSASFIVADLDTGEVLAARDPHGGYAPASTLKTLTAVTFIPRLDPWARVPATSEDVATDGTRVGLDPRIRYSVQELLGSMLVMSANDSASALLRHAGPDGLKLLNQQACMLQAQNTLALTPHGLDAPGQRSSAYDLALIARHGLLTQPTFAHMVKLRLTTISGPGGARLPVYGRNKLLLNYPGALGVKNGFTRAARASFVGAAERGGRRLLVVVMRGDSGSWREAAQLLDWGFAAQGTVRPVGQLAAALPPSEQYRCPLRSVGTTPQRALAPLPSTPPGVVQPIVAAGTQRPLEERPDETGKLVLALLAALSGAGGLLWWSRTHRH